MANSAAERLPLTDVEPSGLHVDELTAKLMAQGAGAASHDVALDLVLNEIVEQARLATTATGAAIALLRDEELVCRATTGINAPDLGVRLNRHSGLSGAAIESRDVQRCDDTETDLRVNAEACRNLNLRSILVVPVVAEEKVLGVFEIFSPGANAFGDRDVQTVQALCRRIVSNLQPAKVVASPSPSRATFNLDATAPGTEVPSVGGEQRMVRPIPTNGVSRTGVLAVSVITLALVLGWMIGRAGWNDTSARTVPPRIISPPVQKLSAESGGEHNTPAQEPGLGKSKPGNSKPVTQSSGRQQGLTPGGLIIYENGKVIFQGTPETPQRVAEAAQNEAAEALPLAVPPEKAKLIHRVEPEYPDEARQQRLQGAVVLETVVAKNGTVREVKAISGDALLAAAATEAVKQWQFRPYEKDGQTVEFQTRVTVNFKLP